MQHTIPPSGQVRFSTKPLPFTHIVNGYGDDDLDELDEESSDLEEEDSDLETEWNDNSDLEDDSDLEDSDLEDSGLEE